LVRYTIIKFVIAIGVSMNNLRKLRRSIDCTLQELADKTDSSKSYIFDVEKGIIENPSIYKCYAIADYLGADVFTVFPRQEKSLEGLKQ